MKIKTKRALDSIFNQPNEIKFVCLTLHFFDEQSENQKMSAKTTIASVEWA